MVAGLLLVTQLCATFIFIMQNSTFNVEYIDLPIILLVQTATYIRILKIIIMSKWGKKINTAAENAQLSIVIVVVACD